MARKIILFLVALLVPGGLTALVIALIASWARKRYKQSLAQMPELSHAKMPASI